MNQLNGAVIHVNGIVQGVGFRPFIYSLALRLGITGWVRNTSAGVDIEVDGESQVLKAFIEAITNEAPPLARIDDVIVTYDQPKGFSSFEILHSQPIPEAFQPISPDVSICPDCLRELFDPNDRRYLYPFINCTNCGPRFTIIEDIPYDRPKTTMAEFEMCTNCAAEYSNPLDRRFHAQPIACPACGPEIWLEPSSNLYFQLTTEQITKPAFLTAQELLLDGKILAIKGLGGFHLACDALNHDAVVELRHRKLRVDKPFAVMMPDVETIEQHCFVDQDEHDLLESRQRPITILKRKPHSPISTMVAPGQDTIGVMLPYTPLHFLLFFNPQSGKVPYGSRVLVMTSGNVSEEPIAIGNDEAIKRLSNLADAFLMHNRRIRTRCDDSVLRVFSAPNKKNTNQLSDEEQDTNMPIRRSRGYAPFPVRLAWRVPNILACGAELKNAFCITRDNYAFMSQHIGDMENYETLHSFEDSVKHYEQLFRIQPQVLACDLHPDYLATRYCMERAEQESLPIITTQHHHAHIAACMAEHELKSEQQVIGISFDGTGYGDDGVIWGGEILVANYANYQRAYYIEYVPLPGGDKAIREPWRMALSWLDHAKITWSENLAPVAFHINPTKENNPGFRSLEVLKYQLQSGINAPSTSSVGRLFDAVAALTGIRQVVNYEAQAAIEFEAMADPYETGRYPIKIPPLVAAKDIMDILPQPIEVSAMVSAIVDDIFTKTPKSAISARFHNSLAQMVWHVCESLRDSLGISTVVLSGGVWQNILLLSQTMQLLSENKFKVLIHRSVPTNDGGLALGQAAIAAHKVNLGS